jgi:hypothetical protein
MIEAALSDGQFGSDQSHHHPSGLVRRRDDEEVSQGDLVKAHACEKDYASALPTASKSTICHARKVASIIFRHSASVALPAKPGWRLGCKAHQLVSLKCAVRLITPPGSSGIRGGGCGGIDDENYEVPLRRDLLACRPRHRWV